MDSATSNIQIKIEKVESLEISPDLPHGTELKESVDRSESESKHQQQSDSNVPSIQIKVEKVESIAETPDLPHGTELKESVDRSESESKHQQQSDSKGRSIADLQLKRRKELSESKHQQQSGSKGPSIADLQLKRRKEFETKFNLYVKKYKKSEYLAIAEEECLQDKVKAPLVQTPQYLKGTPESRRHDVHLPFENIKTERDDEQNTTSSSIKKQLNLNDLLLLLPKRLGISDDGCNLSYKSGNKAEPIHDLDTSNTLNSVKSLPHTSIPPLIQRALDTAYGNQSSDGLEIGPHGTWLSTEDLKKINWTGVSAATRSLLSILFDRQTLARSSLSGNLAPAFPNRPGTERLDPRKIRDIIYFLKCTFHSEESEIRNIITMKCSESRKPKRKRLPKPNLKRILF